MASAWEEYKKKMSTPDKPQSSTPKNGAEAWASYKAGATSPRNPIGQNLGTLTHFTTPKTQISPPSTTIKTDTATKKVGQSSLLEQYWLTSSAPDNPAGAALYFMTNGFKPNRASNVVKGNVKDYVGSIVSAIGTLAQSVANTPAQQYEPKTGLDQWAAAVGGMHDNPVVFAMNQIRSNKESAEAVMELGQDARDYGSKISDEGKQLVQDQKEGLGKVGQTLVDVGSVGTQMALDIGIGWLTGLGMAAPMAVRVFGSSAEKSAKEGANLNQQLAYSFGTAAVAYGLEHLSNVAMAGLKVVAPGVSDDFAMAVIDKLAVKLAKTPAGAAALKTIGTLFASGAGEGFEEILEDFAQPYLQKMTYDPNAKSLFEDPSQLSEYLYDGFLGFIMGLTGASVNASVNTGANTGADGDIKAAYEEYRGIFTDQVVNDAYESLKQNGMFSKQGQKDLAGAHKTLGEYVPAWQKSDGVRQSAPGVTVQEDNKSDSGEPLGASQGVSGDVDASGQTRAENSPAAAEMAKQGILSPKLRADVSETQVAAPSQQIQQSAARTQRTPQEIFRRGYEAQLRAKRNRTIEKSASEDYTVINNKESVSDGNNEVRLRESGKWFDSAYPAGAVPAVESNAGQDQSRAVQRGSADGEISRVSYGEEVSTVQLGIENGSEQDKVYLVDSNSTSATRAAQAVADERGLELVLFAGGDLHTESAPNGARGFTDGKKIFARADDPDFTAEQITRHEAGHNMIARGEIDPGQVRDRIAELIGPENVDTAAKLYAMAYAGSGLSADEVWDECICDSLGGMNIFAGSGSDVETFMEGFIDVAKQEAEVSRQVPRGPPEVEQGQYSRKTETEPFFETEIRHHDIDDDYESWRKNKSDAITRYGLADLEQRAISQYVGGSAYEWTSIQRGETQFDHTEYVDFWIDLATSGFEKMPSFTGRTYRNLVFKNTVDYNEFLNIYAVGKEVSLNEFASASKNPNGYVVNDGHVVHLVIDGFSGKDISNSFGIPSQQEVVYLPGTKLHVDSIKIANDGNLLIFAQEVTSDGKDMGTDFEGSGESSSGADDPRRGRSDRGDRRGGLRERTDASSQIEHGEEIHNRVNENQERSESSRRLSTEELVQEIERIREEGRVQGRSEEDVLEDIRAAVDEVYQGMIEDFGAIKPGEKPYRDIKVPQRTLKDKKVSQTVRTILEAQATPDEVLPDIEELVARGEFSYDVYSDKAAIADAREKLEKDWNKELSHWYARMDRGEVSKANTAMGWALYNNAVNRGDTDMALTILDKIVKHQRNAAQAVQATRILKKLTPETQLYQIQKTVEGLQQDLFDRYGEEKSPTLKIDPELAEQFLQSETQEERDTVTRKIYQKVGQQVPSTFRDKWNALRYLAMLGNVRTHVRNMVGNAGFVPVVLVKNTVATGLEAAANKVTGGKMQRSKALVGFGKQDMELLKAAFGDYGNAADHVGTGKYNDFVNMKNEIEEGRQIFKTKWLEKARKANSAALSTEDVWFAKTHYAYALAQYCKANGIAAQQIAEGNIPDAARLYAIKEAKKATYQDVNQLSELFSRIGRYRGDNTVMQGMSKVVEGILPFRKTPANILARGLEYSPLGLIKTIGSDLGKVKKGEMSSAEMFDDLASNLTGSMLLGFGYFAALSGLVRGSGEDDDNEREFSELQGHQSYALELPDGTSVTLDWLAPECLPFFVGVNLCEARMQRQEDGEALTMADILEAIGKVSDPMLEMSCLQSLSDVFDSVGYASSNDMNPLVTALANATTSYLTQALPTILGQFERTGESVRMTTYTEKNAFLTSDMQYLLGKASSRIPGFDYNQIPYIDAWGRTEESGNVGERAFNNMFNPAYTSDIELTPMEEELVRLYEVTGENVFPSRAAKYFNVDKVRKDLTAEEYVTYATERGQLSQKILTDLTGNREYRKMDDTDKGAVVKLVYNLANAQAKMQVSDYQPDGWIAKAIKCCKEKKIPLELYVICYYVQKEVEVPENLQNEKGDALPDSKGLLKMQAINKIGGLTYAQRLAMFVDFGVGSKVILYDPSKVNSELEKMMK